MAEAPKREKAKIYEEASYDIIKPYDSSMEIFNKQRFDVETIKRNGRVLVIIRNKEEEHE